MKYRSTPYLRFKKFKGKWQLKVLGNLGSVAMNKRIFKEETSEVGEIPFYKIGTFGREPDSFITREKFEEYKSKYPYPEIGDILISASGSIGRTLEYLGEEAYFQDSNIVWLKHDERLDNSFLKQFYSIVKWQGIEGTTIKRLYNKNILETPIALPSVSEQSAIGSLFRNLDDLLASYKDNLANYQSLKATMLSKMFPKAGQTVPEIRLEGFEGEWERKSLSEVCTINSGRDYKHLKDGDIPVYGTGGYMLSVNEKLSDEDAIGIGRKGTIDKPYLLTAPFWTVDTLFYVTCKMGYDLNYLFLIFQQVRWKKFDESTGVPSLSKKTIEKVASKFPSLPEQQAIGSYFSNLDNLISAHREKISQLETLKKKLLQDMFM